MASSCGTYRPTLHPYEIFFQMKTKVQSCISILILKYGFSFSPIVDVCSHSVEYEYLVGKVY